MNASFERQQEVLHSKFNIKTHKETFVRYLEVVIDPEGVVEYAVPSHQEKLIRAMMDKMGITRNDVMKLCPMEYYFDMLTWLCNETGYIAVWDERIEGKPNKKQNVAIQRLAANGLYLGNRSC